MSDFALWYVAMVCVSLAVTARQVFRTDHPVSRYWDACSGSLTAAASWRSAVVFGALVSALLCALAWPITLPLDLVGEHRRRERVAVGARLCARCRLWVRPARREHHAEHCGGPIDWS